MNIRLDEQALFTSDTHLDHKHAAAVRNFASVERMNEHLLNMWNGIVAKDSTVVHMGDFCWYKRTIHNIVPQLNGRIILVLGNHDKEWEKEYEKVGVACCLMATVKIDQQRIECCHFPLWSWDRMKYGAWCLHGHQHGDPTGISGKIHDVGVDANNLQILTYQRLQEIMVDKPVRDHHGN